jgi:lipid-binding SYLF domain-containing protein
MSYPLLANQKDVDRRLDDAATVLSEIMAAPDKGIPEDLLEKAHFARLALRGATLRQDLDNNAALYGERLENPEMVTKRVAPTAAASKLMSQLRKYSPRRSSRETYRKGVTLR